MAHGAVARDVCMTQQQQGEPTKKEAQKPIFSKETGKLLGRASKEGVLFWNKLTRAWELVSWQELFDLVEHPKS